MLVPVRIEVDEQGKGMKNFKTLAQEMLAQSAMILSHCSGKDGSTNEYLRQQV